MIAFFHGSSFTPVSCHGLYSFFKVQSVPAINPAQLELSTITSITAYFYKRSFKPFSDFFDFWWLPCVVHCDRSPLPAYIVLRSPAPWIAPRPDALRFGSSIDFGFFKVQSSRGELDLRPSLSLDTYIIIDFMAILNSDFRRYLFIFPDFSLLQTFALSDL